METLEEKYKIGQEIFEQLFTLSDDELKEKIETIVKDYQLDTYSGCGNGDCIRMIKNGTPEKIEISYYDVIRISWEGISFIDEHGYKYNEIKFNKHFKL